MRFWLGHYSCLELDKREASSSVEKNGDDTIVNLTEMEYVEQQFA